MYLCNSIDMKVAVLISTVAGQLAADDEMRQRTIDSKPSIVRNRESSNTAIPTRKKNGAGTRRRHSQMLTLPRGPVQVIHVEGTDILLIIGQGGDLKLPDGPVTVDAIEELDLLVIRAPGTRSRRPPQGRQSKDAEP